MGSHAGFNHLARRASALCGSPLAFLAAISVVAAWLLTGPLFGYSDTWQLVINTGTTIVTFLMVFLIQNMQNRETRAINLKLDELLRAISTARNDIIDMENVSDEELEEVEEQFHQIKMRLRSKEDDKNHAHE
jgi:low affinity Fe/Cu permease